MVYTTLRDQASILACSDVFLYRAIGAFLVIPATLLFTGSKSGGAPPGAH